MSEILQTRGLDPAKHYINLIDLDKGLVELLEKEPPEQPEPFAKSDDNLIEMPMDPNPE